MQGSSKLKKTYVDRMFKANLTSNAIDLILFLARMQDNTGFVRGVYYKNVCDELCISIQTYYDLIGQLSDAGLIQWEKNSPIDRDIRLVDNDFSYNGALNEGYINVSRSFFFTEEFRKMRAGSKLLALDCLRLGEINHGSFRIGTRKFFERYMVLLKVSIRSLRQYLSEIRQFFSVGIKNHIYYITPKKETRDRLTESEHQRCYRQVAGAACRRVKIWLADAGKAFVGLCGLFDTYKQDEARAIDSGKAPFLASYIMEAVRESICKINAAVERKKDWQRILNPKMVHKCLRDRLIRENIIKPAMA